MRKKHHFPGPEDQKLTVLSGVSLSIADTYCLERSGFLHDTLIEWYLQYLRLIKHRDNSDRVAVIGPSVAQLIKVANWKTARETIEPLRLNQKRLVLAVVNDAAATAKGSHWSLLVVVPHRRSFHHIDSLGRRNERSARILASRLYEALRWTAGAELRQYADAPQDNNFDCGIYVLANADKAIRHFLHNGTGRSFKPAIKADVFSMRSHMLEIIKQVSEQQKRNEGGNM